MVPHTICSSSGGLGEGSWELPQVIGSRLGESCPFTAVQWTSGEGPGVCVSGKRLGPVLTPTHSQAIITQFLRCVLDTALPTSGVRSLKY